MTLLPLLLLGFLKQSQVLAVLGLLLTRARAPEIPLP